MSLTDFVCASGRPFDLVFGIQGFIEVGNESKVGVSVGQDNRFIVLKRYWWKRGKWLSCILTGLCLLAYQYFFLYIVTLFYYYFNPRVACNCDLLSTNTEIVISGHFCGMNLYNLG